MINNDLSNEEYHALEAIGASGLCLLDKSPAHYYARYLDPDREPVEPTPAMALGTAVHTAILEPAEFDNLYTVIPEGLDRRTKEGKQVYSLIKESGKTPLKFDDMKRIIKMQEAVHAHPISKAIWSLDCVFESSILQIDKESGIECKIRPDLYVKPCDDFPNGIVIDLKTTTDASSQAFAKSAFNLKYYIQVLSHN